MRRETRRDKRRDLRYHNLMRTRLLSLHRTTATLLHQVLASAATVERCHQWTLSPLSTKAAIC